MFWTSDILAELESSLRRRRSKAGRRLYGSQTIQEIFSPFEEKRGSLLKGYEHLIDSMNCNEDDRHVSPAAVHSEISTIMMFNLRHFPPEQMVSVLRQQAMSYQNPAMSVEGLLQAFERHGVDVTNFPRLIRNSEFYTG